MRLQNIKIPVFIILNFLNTAVRLKFSKLTFLLRGLRRRGVLAAAHTGELIRPRFFLGDNESYKIQISVKIFRPLNSCPPAI